MILVNANLLLYAEDALSEHNAPARAWWDERLSGPEVTCLAWQVVQAFIRISTNARLHKRPLNLREACERVQSWLDQPCVRVIQPSDNHWTLFQRMLMRGNATANLVSDTHLAALAIEHNCVLYSTDADFARFPDLKWKNPITES
jgi:uncharacterized protein